MLSTPVVVIAFNRPQLTRRTMEAVRDAKPGDLFLVADGPRPDRPEDVSLCAAVREELDRVDWPCQVRRRFSDVNLGCEANVELGLDWAFSQVDRAIILEDDCIPDPSFFAFCEELLERYGDDDRVWHVAGNSHWVPEKLFGGASYQFSSWASVWGWATWRRAWQRHRDLFPRAHGSAPGSTSAPVRTRPASPRATSLVTPSGRRHFAAVARSSADDEYGWDSHWWVTLLTEGKLSVTPAVNLVTNDGYGEGATHTRSSRPPTPATATAFPLTHPPAVALCEPVERELELVLLRANGRLARAARKVIRPLWMRGVVRRVVGGPVATATLRTLSTTSTKLRRSWWRAVR
jgi:hypothetical protein